MLFFLALGNKLVYTKLFLKRVFTEKITGFIFLTVLLLGGFSGMMLARFQCTSSDICLPSLHDFSVAVSGRHLISLIAADSLFSVLLLLCSLSGYKKALFFCLFFLKGFCISYFIFLFVYFYQAHGLLFAASVLLLHSFFLLPLQLTSVYLLQSDAEGEQRKNHFPTLCALNLAAAFLCAVIEYYSLPAIFSSHIRF